mgnify:CR=1 FL=1
MEHESDIEKMIDVIDTELSFESVYKKKYMPKEYEDEIKSANVLLIPNENFRGKQGLFFPECTDELLDFMKEQENENVKVDICISDEDFKKIRTARRYCIHLLTMIVQCAVLPITTGIIAAYLYDKLNKSNKSPKETNTDVNVIVEKNGKSKMVHYQGSIEKF